MFIDDTFDDSSDPADTIAVDCATCLAANTTACGECLVTHVLANDSGPIPLVVVDPAVAAIDRAVALFDQAGLIDLGDAFVDPEVFDAAGSSQPVSAPATLSPAGRR